MIATCIYCKAPATRWCDRVIGFDSAGSVDGCMATLESEIYRCDAALCEKHASFQGNVFFSGAKGVAGAESIDYCHTHGNDSLMPISSSEAAGIRYRHKCAASGPFRLVRAAA